jgi:hypothetical protein
MNTLYSIDRLEILSIIFKKQTGFVRPALDDCTERDAPEERQFAYQNWLKNEGRTVYAVFDAIKSMNV